MSERETAALLMDILESCKRISEYTSGKNYEQFKSDTKTQDAVIRNFEIMGEATKNLPSEVRDNYPEAEWRLMAGFRDRLIHAYFGINLEIVWSAITSEVPKIVDSVRKVLEQEDA